MKEKIKEKFNSAKKFVEDHALEIAAAAAILTAGLVGMTGYAIHEKKNNITLNNKNATLDNVVHLQASELEHCRDRIDNLVDLCNRKDNVAISTFSDGMRHGSSECARQMSYYGHQKAEIAKA